MSDTLYVLLWQLGLCFSSFLLGVVSLLTYMLYRMMNNPGWDDSNITNALRLLSHVVLHPPDFFKMFYLHDEQLKMLIEHELELFGETVISKNRPFWYIARDELSGVVGTRPPPGAVS